MADEISFEEYREEWLEEITDGYPSTTEKGHRFSHKLITQWLDISLDTDDIIYCDGAGDGGIDLAYLQRDEVDGNGTEGHTWFLVQSKYGCAFQGADTLLKEAQKVVETLGGFRSNLSSLTQDLVERLGYFIKQASENDRLILVFATIDPLTEDLFRVLNDIRVMGQGRMGSFFDVSSVSVRSIYEKMVENTRVQQIRVPMKAIMAETGNGLLVGTVSLDDLYQFLKGYQRITGDLDQIYEKNVRRFLGGGGRVNSAIQKTLESRPERFGLYNNGITIVVNDFQRNNGMIDLIEPYIVNGCQTTRTIWEVLRRRLEAGGKGFNPELESWKQQIAQGVVVTKIVKVGDTGEGLLVEITRFTNSQNAVREKDFLALVGDFKNWQNQMSDQYGIYLEIQRGGWDSQKAFQRQHPDKKQFKEVANAFDLLKVYGSGWLAEAGVAFGKNAPFLPNGSIYRRIVNMETGKDPFDIQDLYAAYRIQKIADSYGFGRGSENITRRQTRFLFYMVAIDLLKDVMTRASIMPEPKSITRAMIELFEPEELDARSALFDAAIEVVDTYMTSGLEETVFLEPAFQSKFNNDLNAFLKWDLLGKNEEATPRLRNTLAVTRITLGRKAGALLSPRDLIIKAIR